MAHLEGDDKMAKYLREPQKKKVNIDQKHLIKQRDTYPILDRYQMINPDSPSMTGTTFNPGIEEHSALLSRMPLTAQRQGLIMQLQQSLGNQYVQRLLESVQTRAKYHSSNSVGGYDTRKTGSGDTNSIDFFPGPRIKGTDENATRTSGSVTERSKYPNKPVHLTNQTGSVNLINNKDSTTVAVSLSAFVRGDESTAEGKETPAVQEEETPVLGSFDALTRTNLVQLVSPGGVDIGSTAFGEYKTDILEKSVEVVEHPGTFSSDWEIKLTLRLDYHWAVQSQGCTDIRSPDDNTVTDENWLDIYSDLLPSGGGLPTRERYWCSDLSAQHELFHINDSMNAFRNYLPETEDWIKSQPIRNKTGAENAGIKALNQLIIKVGNYMGTGPGSPQEGRAYAAGSSQYVDRANSVYDRAVTEGWMDWIYGADEEYGAEEYEEEEESEEKEVDEEEGEGIWDELWDELWEEDEEIEEEEAEESNWWDELWEGEEEEQYGYGESPYNQEEGYEYGDEEEPYYEDEWYGYGEESYNEEAGYIY
jgi:hypothetical protein